MRWHMWWSDERMAHVRSRADPSPDRFFRAQKGWKETLMSRRIVHILVLFLVLLPVTTLRAQGTDPALQPTLAYMRSQQGADGTFAGFGAGSTADAVIALATAGVNSATFNNGGASALDGLTNLAPEAAKDPGVAAKFVLATVAAQQNPRALGGTDLVAAVEQGFDSATGRYGKDVTAHALALLALHATGTSINPAAISATESLQLPDGGWSFDGTAATGSDTNTTALVLQALAAAAPSSAARAKGIAYLRTQQNDDGGFPYSQTSQFGNASDANSTALSIQAILANNENLDDWTKAGATPATRLLALQNPSGAFRFQDEPADDNQLATYQAVPAVLGRTLLFDAASADVPAPSPATLPNTGASSWPWALLASAGALGAAGWALRRSA
jgi:LPXTG-motif cell wall-anchored protein